MSVGTLYVVATPLGNLGDLSPRAAAVLRAVDLVAAEDTRRSQRLLASIDAHPRLLSCHAHSTERRIETLVEKLRDGRDIALVTDAGTPGISDPGTALVSAARAAGAAVIPIPGPTAVATALSASALSGDRYLFLGFLPRRGGARQRLLQRAAHEPWSVVCYEAPGRLVELLRDFAAVAGDDRNAVVARELTKVHEEIRCGTLATLRAYYQNNAPRGEVTVIVAGRPESAEDPDEPRLDPITMEAEIAQALAAGATHKDVVKMVMAQFNLSRNEAYRLVMGAR